MGYRLGNTASGLALGSSCVSLVSPECPHFIDEPWWVGGGCEMRVFITADRTKGKMSYKPLSLGDEYYGPILLTRKLRTSPFVTREDQA